MDELPGELSPSFNLSKSKGCEELPLPGVRRKTMMRSSDKEQYSIDWEKSSIDRAYHTICPHLSTTWITKNCWPRKHYEEWIRPLRLTVIAQTDCAFSFPFTESLSSSWYVLTCSRRRSRRRPFRSSRHTQHTKRVQFFFEVSIRRNSSRTWQWMTRIGERGGRTDRQNSILPRDLG